MKITPQENWRKYRSAVFCPVIKGDTPYQKRFYDVIASGCIPVVTENGGMPLKANHPFAARPGKRGVPGFSINYGDFVVWTSSRTIAGDLAALLADPEKLAAKQRSLKRAALSLVYDVGRDGHSETDAFAGLLGRLDDHVGRLDELGL